MKRLLRYIIFLIVVIAIFSCFTYTRRITETLIKSYEITNEIKKITETFLNNIKNDDYDDVHQYLVPDQKDIILRKCKLFKSAIKMTWSLKEISFASEEEIHNFKKYTKNFIIATYEVRGQNRLKGFIYFYIIKHKDTWKIENIKFEF